MVSSRKHLSAYKVSPHGLWEFSRSHLLLFFVAIFSSAIPASFSLLSLSARYYPFQSCSKVLIHRIVNKIAPSVNYF